ncbi:hypothetical protein B0H13DRAFT_1913554 [Mycena leptocephala]|nr:hypothetical protein B0H13DRAFT_1913554 [Mycena leptocephala]
MSIKDQVEGILMARNSVMDLRAHAPRPDYSRFNSSPWSWFGKMIFPCSQHRSLNAADENQEVTSKWIVAQSEGRKGKECNEGSNQAVTRNGQGLCTHGYRVGACRWRRQSALKTHQDIGRVKKVEDDEHGNGELLPSSGGDFWLRIASWGVRETKRASARELFGNPESWLRTIALRLISQNSFGFRESSRAGITEDGAVLPGIREILQGNPGRKGELKEGQEGCSDRSSKILDRGIGSFELNTIETERAHLESGCNLYLRLNCDQTKFPAKQRSGYLTYEEGNLTKELGRGYIVVQASRFNLM